MPRLMRVAGISSRTAGTLSIDHKDCGPSAARRPRGSVSAGVAVGDIREADAHAAVFPGRPGRIGPLIITGAMIRCWRIFIIMAE
jgi:hypothetical protein